ncbi:MAG: endonuclease III [Syntrophales bacterium]|nr:endonuclease III [Syntrophales bacterium]
MNGYEPDNRAGVMGNIAIGTIIGLIEEALEKKELPIVTKLAEEHRDPFEILISTLLSLRTKDEVTALATARLFSLAQTPSAMAALTKEEIRKAIYPVGFYRNKTETIHEVCLTLIDRYASLVPDSIEELLTMRGVGRKTANLVVALGFNGPGICVDIHVHRISNRLGYVHTKNPEETEFALRKKLPKQYWIKYNTLMVSFGRNICRPVSPICSICPVSDYCRLVGVTKSR